MKSEYRKRLIAAFAAISVISMGATALPANAADPGVTSTEIKLGITLPMTEAARYGYNQIPAAMKAYFDYVNANGGVNGRKVTLIVKDDRYQTELAKKNTLDLITKDKVFALVGALGTANNIAADNFVGLARRGVPSLFLNTGFSGFANAKKYPTMYSILPSYVMEAKIMAEYIKDTYPGKRIGLVYQNDDFGTDALAGFKQAKLKFDVEVPYSSLTQAQAGVADSWITALKGNVDVVVLFGVSSATMYAVQAAAKASFAPKWILGSVGGDVASISPALIPYVKGSTSMSFLPSTTDATDEYITLFKEINAKYNKNAGFNNWTLVGMNSAFLTVQALAAAGKTPTRKALISALNKQAATLSSAALVPLNFTATSHAGYNGYWFGNISATGDLVPNDGKYVLYTTDSGAGAVVKSTYKRPAMPAKGLPN